MRKLILVFELNFRNFFIFENSRIIGPGVYFTFKMLVKLIPVGDNVDFHQ